MKEATSEFEKIQAVSDTDYEKYIQLKRKEIVDYHLKNNKSYQELIAKSNFNPETSDWNELPIMTKKDFQKPLSERLSNGFTTKNVYTWTSLLPQITYKSTKRHVLLKMLNIILIITLSESLHLGML